MKSSLPKILNFEQVPTDKDYSLINIYTWQGIIHTRFYEAKEKQLALLFVGGVGGGFDVPARDLYPRLAHHFMKQKMSSLHLKYRDSLNLQSSIYDVLIGIEILRRKGISRICLIGHSFGGAVVIAAATHSPLVVSIITLATQSFGARPAIPHLGDRALLLIHGLEDDILPFSNSVSLYEMAIGPKQIDLIPDAGHTLEESVDDVYQLCEHWIQKTLPLR
jgi:predicted esterase